MAGTTEARSPTFKELAAERKHNILARRPEKLLINDCALIQTLIEKLATSTAYLALTWSTVVLLGGFVSDIKYKDFWYLTSISMVFAIGIVPALQYPAAAVLAVVRHYVTLHIGLVDMEQKCAHPFLILCVKLSSACLGASLVMCSLVTFAIGHIVLLWGPVISMVISLMRLIQKDYGVGANREKLTVAMDIFYSLTLVQGVFFYLWGLFVVTRDVRASSVSRKCGFGKWGYHVVRAYLRETTTMSSRDGKLPGKRNLITYAVGLLENDPDDYLSGARILDAFVRDKIPIEPAVSKLAIQNLIQVLGRSNPEPEEREMKERAARIVTDLTSNLHIDEFPGALWCIASLLEPQTAVIQADNATRKRKGKGLVYDYNPTEELILQGLLILERLTKHQDNCMAICKDQRLLSMITSPVTSHAFLNTDHDDTMVEIFIMSLRVVARLISAPEECSRKLRNDILRKEKLVDNMQKILETGNAAPGLKTATIEILTALASDLSTSMSDKNRERFISAMKSIFLGDMTGSNQGAEGRLRKRAGEALAKMLSVWGVTSSNIMMSMLLENSPSGISGVDQLVPMLVTDKMCQTSAAEILEHLCPKFTDEQKKISLLATVLALILHSHIETNDEAGARSSSTTAVEAVENHPPNDADPNESSSEQNDDQSVKRKYIAALLSLTVTIWDKLLQKDDFFRLAPADETLVKKLKEIIQRNNEASTDCLRIVKVSCEVVIAMVRHKPSWIERFVECKFMESLFEALKTMADVDKCMLFAASGREAMNPSRSLSSLVKEASQLLEKKESPQSVNITIAELGDIN